MALTILQVKNSKPREKAYKLTDQKGLYLMVHPTGSKTWKYRYRFAGKEKKLTFGPFPEVTLQEARDKQIDARRILNKDIDPGMLKQSRKRALRDSAENSFESIAREWHTRFYAKWTKDHASRILIRLEQNAFPYFGRRPIREITAPEILEALRRVEMRGAIETAHRVQQICSQVFRYAIASGLAERDPSVDLRGALAPVKKRHHASITDPIEVGKLLRDIHAYKGFQATKCALQLAPLVFVRPGELRRAEWSEFNLNEAEWRIPAEKMKMRSIHIVPLSKQALEIVRQLEPLTGHGKYLFPSLRSGQRPMSETAVLGALRRIGYTTDEMTGHGFRSTASTLLNENGWNRDAIERQLAHAERDNIRAAYNYAEYLPERKQMMQWWADYLDQLAATKPTPTEGADKIAN